MDAFGNPTERDPPNPFVQLLWHRGMLHAREVMQDRRMPVLDLSASRGEEKERRTQEALEEGAPFIYGGEIGADDLLGAPGLLRREGGGYVASDIKSGASEEGPEEHRRLKVHYAVQLALYTDVLERKGSLPVAGASSGTSTAKPPLIAGFRVAAYASHSAVTWQGNVTPSRSRPTGARLPWHVRRPPISRRSACSARML